MGDYDMATADNTNFYVQWGDNRSGNPDVRFALVPKAGVVGGTPPSLGLAGQNITSTMANTCNNLTITVVNDGCNSTAGPVSGNLTTSTAGVTILDATQNYGTIAGGGTASNANPFRVSVASTFACGTTIALTLTMSSGEVIPVSITTMSAGSYSFTTMTGQAIVPGSVDIGNHADDGTTLISLPFTFNFYGSPFTTVNASSNGNLQFNSTDAAFSNACPLPYTGF